MEVFKIEKYQIKIDNSLVLNCDSLGYEYSQLDSESSGRSEDGTMYRDVIGLTHKIYCGFERMAGANLRKILKLIEKTSCTLTYYDPKDGAFVTRNMYIVVDQINITLINGEEMADPFEMRFIQMNVTSI